MNILLISSYLPYPLTNGGHIRLYNLMKELQKKHEITLICEKRDHQTEDDINEVEKICKKVLTVPRKKQWSLGNIIKSGFSKQPFLVTGHTSSEMRQLIDHELFTNHYDLIHVETFYVLQNVSATQIPIVLVEHNIEYKVYERFANRSSLITKPLLKADIRKIKQAEQKAWQRATKVVTVSEDDKKVINLSSSTVVPNGVDTALFTLKNTEKEFQKGQKKILYIGDYSWVQNRDAVEFIVKDIWPEIEKKSTNTTLWIVGRNMPESFSELGKNNPRINIDKDNQMQTPEIFTEASVLLAPKRVGGGTSYKTLEALAVGTPVVTNSLGLEGLGVEKNHEVLVSDSALGLAEEVLRVLNDASLYYKLAVNGRKHVESNFDWKAITQKLDSVYLSAIYK